MHPILFFDIETAVNLDALPFLPEPTALGNYKDAEKIAQYVAEKKTEQITQAPLDADLGRVTAITLQCGLEDALETHLIGDMETPNEADLLRWFWSRFLQMESYACAITTWALTCRICCAVRLTCGSLCRSRRGWRNSRSSR